MLAAQLHANEVRQRLRNPPNAVPDYGIDLKRKNVIPVAPLETVSEPDAVFGPAIAKSIEDIAFGPIVHPPEVEPKKPSVEQIIAAVSWFYQVTRDDIRSARRTANIVRPRQVAFYLSKVLTLRSLPDIGRRFGGRDHTTALHSIRKITGILESGEDAKLASEVNELKDLIARSLS